MTDRTVVYRLRADATQLRAQMAAAAASTKQAATEMGTNLNKQASKGAAALDGLGINAGTVALAVGTTVVLAAANFDKAMSSVQAATHESAANMDALRQAALDAGAQTSFSATEAAAGIQELAKAGVSTADILGGGLAGALDLAAAGGLGVAEASETAATALTQFKLQGEDVPHVADLLAAAAGKAQGSVSDMGSALKQSGLVAAQVGLTLEETTGTLAAFASAGLVGSDAGTSFKTFLQSLTPSSKAARDAMAAMNFSAYDAQGNFKGMAAVAGELRAGLSGMSKEQQNATLKTIFGSDAVRAASVIYEQGATGISDWTANVNDAGYAAETAAIQMDNLKGDVEALKGALETAFIESGSDSQGTLRSFTQLATDAVNLQTEAGKADGALGGLRDSAMSAISPLAGMSDEVGWLADKINVGGDKTEDLDKKTESLAQTSTTAAGGLEAQARASEGAAQAAKITAGELEAMSKALKESRDEARGTAGSFVNLGDALNDNKTSLSEWITQMAESADALNNFTSNSEKAADRGLRKGLIASLQDAGEEGALRMKQLANGTKEELERANAAWDKGQKAIDRYVDATVKVPKALRTKVDVDGVPTAITNIDRIRNALAQVKDKSVTIRVTQAGTAAITPGFGPQTNAAGGYIAGPGTATSDSIPSYLSNGEYVIKAAAVAKYGIHTFDRLNAMHFAKGGSVDKGRKSGGLFVNDNTTALERSIERLSDRLEHQTEATQEASERTQEWAAKMADVAQATTSGFSTGLFERDSNPWAAGAGGGWLANLTRDISGLEQRGALQSQLAGAGLSGDALAALLAQGSNSDLSAILASGQTSQYAALFNQRAALQGSVGAAAGQQAYGAQYAYAQQREGAYMAEQVKTTAAIGNLTNQVAQIQGAIAAAAESAGESFGSQLRGEVVSGHRAGRHGGGHG